MWALPNIDNLNSQAKAVARALRDKAARINQRIDKKIKCEHCEGKVATHAELYFDIFSEDPKGLIASCNTCWDKYGSTPDGFFYCDTCERIMVENYTWELYFTRDEFGNQECLKCACDKYITEPSNWIELTDENIAALTFDRIRQAPHVLGVSMPVPKSIVELGGETLDGSTGGRVMGFSSAESGTEGTVRSFRDLLATAKNEGHKRALLILDGGYQFAVSISVYVDSKASKKSRKVA